MNASNRDNSAIQSIKKNAPCVHARKHSHHIRNQSYQSLIHRYPDLVHRLLDDLLKIEGYSEVTVGFGTGLHLDLVRKIVNKNIRKIPERAFFDILGLYARVFCNWYHYKEIEEYE